MNIKQLSSLSFFILILSGCGEDEKINAVKNSFIDDDRTIKISAILEGRPICKSNNWSHKKDDIGRDIIIYTCNFEDQSKLMREKRRELIDAKISSLNENINYLEALQKNYDDEAEIKYSKIISSIEATISSLKDSKKSFTKEIDYVKKLDEKVPIKDFYIPIKHYNLNSGIRTSAYDYNNYINLLKITQKSKKLTPDDPNLKDNATSFIRNYGCMMGVCENLDYHFELAFDEVFAGSNLHYNKSVALDVFLYDSTFLNNFNKLSSKFEPKLILVINQELNDFAKKTLSQIDFHISDSEKKISKYKENRKNFYKYLSYSEKKEYDEISNLLKKTKKQFLQLENNQQHFLKEYNYNNFKEEFKWVVNDLNEAIFIKSSVKANSGKMEIIVSDNQNIHYFFEILKKRNSEKLMNYLELKESIF